MASGKEASTTDINKITWCIVQRNSSFYIPLGFLNQPNLLVNVYVINKEDFYNIFMLEFKDSV